MLCSALAPGLKTKSSPTNPIAPILQCAPAPPAGRTLLEGAQHHQHHSLRPHLAQAAHAAHPPSCSHGHCVEAQLVHPLVVLEELIDHLLELQAQGSGVQGWGGGVGGLGMHWGEPGLVV